MAKKQKFFEELLADMEKRTTAEDIVSKKGTGQRVKECAISLELFAKTYFPDVFSSEFSPLHKEFFKSVEDIILNRKRRKNYYVRAAPRGHGKSQVLSFLLPLWCIVYKYKQNILIVSDTLDQARGFIQAIKTELEENDLLKADFGNLVSEEKWAQDKIITLNKVQVYGRGAGQKLRGNKYGSIRPQLIIIDKKQIVVLMGNHHYY